MRRNIPGFYGHVGQEEKTWSATPPPDPFHLCRCSDTRVMTTDADK